MAITEIHNLIIKYLNDELSDSENKILVNWLNKSENRTVFKKHIALNRTLNADKQQFDYKEPLKKALEKISSENQIQKPTLIRKLKPYFKYAAILVIAVATSFYFFENNFDKISTPKIVNEIKVGTDKATLTLENGTTIALEKGKNFNSETVNSDGEKIIYNSNSATDPTSEKIAYNYLTIPTGGEFYIELADNTKVWLNSESQLKYPVTFQKGKTREVELLYGEAYFEVSPSTQHNGAKFKVHTQQQTIEVLGTQFNVKAYANEQEIYTTLAQGKVKVAINGVTEMLQPSQQTTYNKTTKSIDVSTVDVAYETAWRTGYFNFTNKPFIEVAEVLARWYNVEFHFENEALKQFKINGVISKDQNVEYFLFTLKNIENITYQIKDKHIYIK